MKEAGGQGGFWRFGRRMYRYRWSVAILWLVLFAFLGWFAQQTPGLLKDSGFTPKGSESDSGTRLLQEELGFPSSTLTFVYESNSADLTSPDSVQAIMDSLQSVRKLPYVEGATLLGAKRLDGSRNVQAVLVALGITGDEAVVKYEQIRSAVQAPAGMKVSVTGASPVIYDLQVASKHDIAKAELIGLPIALIVLLIIFRTIPGAMLPLVVGAVSVSVTLGIMFFVAHRVSLSNFLPNMVTMLGLAVGIDYALFMVSRFREELKRQHDVLEAVAVTCQTAGRSIFFSGAAVLIGLIGMLFVKLTIFRTLSLGGVLVVTVSVAVANTLLPALLGILGHRINAWRVLPSRRSPVEEGAAWRKIASGVMRRPILLVAIVSLALLGLMSPLGTLRLGVPTAGELPPSYESRHGADLLSQTYDSREASPIQIAVHTPKPVDDAESIRRLRAYAKNLKALAGVRSVWSFLDKFEGLSDEQTSAALQQPEVRKQLEAAKLLKGNAAYVRVIPEADPHDPEADALVHRIRKLDPHGMTVYAAGETAFRVDIVDRIGDRLPVVVGFVMFVTYFVLLAAFRSLLLPLKAVLMNVLSLGASLGIVVMVFQYGWLAHLLRITSTGYVSATLPVIIFCVVFGISMDYEVFLISRIAEEYESTGDNEKSTLEGLVRTGGLITSAAFILVVVVGSFIFTDIELMKALGLGLAAAVTIDATIVRVALVPALMKLLGAANWWAPRWLKRGGQVRYNKG